MLPPAMPPLPITAIGIRSLADFVSSASVRGWEKK